jgi:hypothetical protein
VTMLSSPPPCPTCRTTILVDSYNGTEQWICYDCMGAFSDPDVRMTDRVSVDDPSLQY